MADLLYHTFTFFALFSYGTYHLVLATRSFFKPTTSSSSSSRSAPAAAGDYTAHPYYPLPCSPQRHHVLRHLPLYLSVLSLLISIIHHALSSVAANRFFSLQYAVSLLFFLLLAASLFLPIPLPPDLVFLLSAVAFALLSSISSAYQPSDLQSKCESVSSVISAACAAFSLALAVCPRLFLAELALASSISLQGLWALQTCLSLYVEGFIPQGCHRLLDVAIESTRCEIEESRIRAAALLDLAFMLHTTFIAVITVAVYAYVAWVCGGCHTRRYGVGAYEALPTSSSSGGLADLDHVQMKTIIKNSMQA
ncbi:hypothetical protein HPP92_006148 [Vanilla planifolia]|uniref:Uncharacterized protein n=1 Tax=Vanilla planifolia TaxID=51239 RepID=A0A835RNX9_VANPL|nr:hypothetical protein HPP92_006441 [Vanilla planifolia]KAG0495154.1 hypothetical protein HPP92_006148 [Vanilla planifolia]